MPALDQIQAALSNFKLRRYLFNCFLLLIPILVWNIFLYDDLPEAYHSAIFEKDIPKFIVYGESILRVLVFGIPTLMILSFQAKIQKTGLIIYLLGSIFYYTSWIMQINAPAGIWSQSLIGYIAPALSTIVFFIGIGLIGQKTFFDFPYVTKVYIGLPLFFVGFHTAHAYIVFHQI